MLLSGGCSSNGQQRSQTAVEGLQDTRNQIVQGHAQVDKVLAAMNAMQTTNDLKSAFSNFSDEVDNTDSQAQDIKASVQNMKDNSAEYIQKWQEEMSTITDPNLKSVADARRTAVQNQFSNIEARYATARDSYKVFHNDLTSLRTYLSNDLTPAGVTATKSMFDKANADGATLHTVANDLTSTIDQVTNALPGGAPPAAGQ
jgi:chromosome segregation ATPase